MLAISADCSVITKWFSCDKEESLKEAYTLFVDVYEGIVKLIVPELLLYELINVLVKSKKLNEKNIEESIHKINKLPITFARFDRKLQMNTIKLTIKHNLTAYDASYLAVARDHEVALLTCDKDLLKTNEKNVIALRQYRSHKRV